MYSKWDGVSVPEQAKTKREHKIPPPAGIFCFDAEEWKFFLKSHLLLEVINYE
jgi:hypothetical protein